LKVVDSTAFSLCMDNKMPMRVFGMDNISAALLGSEVGTRVRA
jgi:uridylate kinase